MIPSLGLDRLVARSRSDAAPAAVRTPPWNALLWLIGAGCWTALALLSVTETAVSLTYQGQPVHWGRLIAWRTLDWYSCALFVPAFLELVRRWPIERRSWLRRLPLYAAASIAATFAKYALMVPLQHSLFGARGTLSSVLAGEAISELMTFWAVIGVLHAIEFHRRYREREALALQLRAQLSEAQLQALRAQLHPHFLFNTLNAATTLIHRDPDAADTMLTRLGELLRLTLRAEQGHETRLRQELLLLDRYLDIMRARFSDQLVVSCEVPESLMDALVPTFVLQPLVENALEHGVARLDGPGRVEILGRRDDEFLVLSVRDDGPGKGSFSGESSGIGLSNTHARLTELYGARATLVLRGLPAGGTEAELRLPLRRDAAA